ncbi:hypothetical protein C1I95_12755 [Micromonospora craterilacus]|uniref:Uncharacterized protein n=1 Tax=Micromonospora craterilacus TaxID=1655439 RepID=A0A2W2EQ91_9ACTN|nr:hypothetical protein C1I95_12755 [Micromonospora craterilacus]
MLPQPSRPRRARAAAHRVDQPDHRATTGPGLQPPDRARSHRTGPAATYPHPVPLAAGDRSRPVTARG